MTLPNVSVFIKIIFEESEADIRKLLSKVFINENAVVTVLLYIFLAQRTAPKESTLQKIIPSLFPRTYAEPLAPAIRLLKLILADPILYLLTQF